MLTLAEFIQISPFEIVLFSIGLLFTLVLLGVFIFVFTRKDDRE